MTLKDVQAGLKEKTVILFQTCVPFMDPRLVYGPVIITFCSSFSPLSSHSKLSPVQNVTRALSLPDICCEPSHCLPFHLTTSQISTYKYLPWVKLPGTPRGWLWRPTQFSVHIQDSLDSQVIKIYPLDLKNYREIAMKIPGLGVLLRPEFESLLSYHTQPCNASIPSFFK